MSEIRVKVTKRCL